MIIDSFITSIVVFKFMQYHFCNVLMMDKDLIMKLYLIGKKYTIIFVFISRINPRIAIKMKSTMARDILKSERFEKEFTKMFISNEESTWNSNFFIPIKCNTEGCFSSKNWDYCIPNPILQVCCLSHFPFKIFSCFVEYQN